MTWRSPFADGPCRVEVVTIAVGGGEQPVFDQPMVFGGAATFMLNCLDYDVAVSQAGEVSLSGMQVGANGGVFEIRVFPHAPIDAPMQAAGITSDITTGGLSIQSVSIGGADDWVGGSTLLALDGSGPSWVPDPCAIPDQSVGVKPVLWSLYADAPGW